jgi:protein arginine N-methyltransferase 1
MLDEHLGYVADRTRLELFETAIQTTLKPGDRVVDLGCGTGVLGLKCLQAGASRVVAIDSTAMLEVARETFARAGMTDRVDFIRGDSLRVELPDRADLVICDQVGYFGFDYGIVHTLADARRRFLGPGGSLIPRTIRLQIGVVQSEKCRDKVDGWRADHVPAEVHWVRRLGVNTKHDCELGSDELLSGAAVLGDIDLSSDNPEFFSWTAELRIERDGVMHGLAGWFECELAERVWMTNSPLADRAIDRPQVFLPLDEPVEVKEKSAVRATVMARPAEHLVAWVVEVPGSGQRFSHSTWEGMMLTPEDLVRANPDGVPRLSREGEARMTVLGYCDGRRTVREIEQAVLRDHPDLLPSTGEISRFVAQALGRDTDDGR